MKLPLYHVDVFTSTRFGGNPLAVFLDAEGLDGDTMQKIAREMNLSESTFVTQPTDERATHHVRIFTPGKELPFAGHPTLGTAHVCRALGLGGDAMRLDMQAGLIEVTAHDRCTALPRT